MDGLLIERTILSCSPAAMSKLGSFVHPTLPVSSGRDT